jgi:hypothetical protein
MFMNHKPKRLVRSRLCDDLGGLGGSDLLAVLVVSDTRGRSSVAAALSGSDTVIIVSKVWPRVEGKRGGEGVCVSLSSAKVHLSGIHSTRWESERVVVPLRAPITGLETYRTILP